MTSREAGVKTARVQLPLFWDLCFANLTGFKERLFSCPSVLDWPSLVISCGYREPNPWNTMSTSHARGSGLQHLIAEYEATAATQSSASTGEWRWQSHPRDRKEWYFKSTENSPHYCGPQGWTITGNTEYWVRAKQFHRQHFHLQSCCFCNIGDWGQNLHNEHPQPFCIFETGSCSVAKFPRLGWSIKSFRFSLPKCWFSAPPLF